MDPDPFAFSEFNSSYLLLDQVMKKLKNLSYTLGMISEELNISTTQINNYLDSYVVVPNLPLNPLELMSFIALPFQGRTPAICV